MNLTARELNRASAERLGVVADPGGAWWALRTFVPLVHAPTGGPWSFDLRPSYIAAATGASAADRDESRQRLVLVDGYVADVWRPVDSGIEATAFHPLSDETWAGLGAEASSLVEFLADREPTVQLRYARWWTGLPSAEVRVLPGS
ncbi:MAG: hypothetical protein DLM58_12670 [Pseudonocardiales bacterium]|nr:MAG: hypothetical protein DLM58_12670 [Pseudonocardiales bacterium]